LRGGRRYVYMEFARRERRGKRKRKEKSNSKNKNQGFKI